MTIFEKIVKGEIPAYKVWENSEFLAFLDIRPVTPGHTLVIPKVRVDPVFEMSEDQYAAFFKAGKTVAQILKNKIDCERVCMAVVGFEVPHAHIHLIPAQSAKDFPFGAGTPAQKEDLERIWKSLKG